MEKTGNLRLEELLQLKSMYDDKILEKTASQNEMLERSKIEAEIRRLEDGKGEKSI